MNAPNDQLVTFDTLNSHVLLAPHYREEHERLINDPIIREMAAEIPAGVDLTTGAFMQAASRTYHDRGGTNARSIGGPGQAIQVIHAQTHQHHTNPDRPVPPRLHTPTPGQSDPHRSTLGI